MSEFDDQFDALIEKYTELLLGESTSEKKEMVTRYALYSFIAKNMPALVKHWNSLYPEGKGDMKEMVEQIKEWNRIHREQTKGQDDS
ncbi:YusU family protein [Rossellomorea marisflavi]|uniref:YusU family protein n=1 Tax=Rossellomorea marisflavi TaxID=189381 RepID=UPI0027A31D23|nr:YusU family protein [Rossellomorea marisflavi]UTE73867.1 YusU family protein [Rossellomorea marisflavi]